MSYLDLGFLAHPEGTKCYKVSEDYEGHSVFVWARFNAEARRYGANALNADWDSVECERFKTLDTFEGNLLTWCLEDGWQFECTECYGLASLEGGCVVVDDEDVFCSQAHADKFAADLAAKEALRSRFLAYAKIKFPNDTVDLVEINTGGDGLVFCAAHLDRPYGVRIIELSELPPL